MRLYVRAVAGAFGILWGACVFFLGVANMIWPTYGQAILQLCASIYPGYRHETCSPPISVSIRWRYREHGNDGQRLSAAHAGSACERAAGLAGHGSEGTRRRLRSICLCTERAAGNCALPSQQRAGARASRRTEAPGLWIDANRGARHLLG